MATGSHSLFKRGRRPCSDPHLEFLDWAVPLGLELEVAQYYSLPLGMSAQKTLWVRTLIVIVLATVFLATLFHQLSFGNWKSLTNNFIKNSASLPTTSTQRYRESPPSLEAHFVPPNLERKDYREWNARTLRDLHSCIALDNCGPNQRKVALLAAHWFQQAVVEGFRGGEGIW